MAYPDVHLWIIKYTPASQSYQNHRVMHIFQKICQKLEHNDKTNAIYSSWYFQNRTDLLNADEDSGLINKYLGNWTDLLT